MKYVEAPPWETQSSEVSFWEMQSMHICRCKYLLLIAMSVNSQFITFCLQICCVLLWVIHRMEMCCTVMVMLVTLLHTPVILDTCWLEQLLESVWILRDGLNLNHIVLVRHYIFTPSILSIRLILLHAAVTCPSLTDPSDGTVSYGSRDYTSVATYTCDFGYELFGPLTRTCQASGVWSGSETTCQRMWSNKYYISWWLFFEI